MGIKIRKGDTVMVIAGDDKGKTGRLLSVDSEKHRVVVEKVNFVKRHTKARRQGMQSGIIEKEARLRLSKVQLYDAKSGRGNLRFQDDDLMRVALAFIFHETNTFAPAKADMAAFSGEGFGGIKRGERLVRNVDFNMPFAGFTKRHGPMAGRWCR